MSHVYLNQNVSSIMRVGSAMYPRDTEGEFVMEPPPTAFSANATCNRWKKITEFYARRIPPWEKAPVRVCVAGRQLVDRAGRD